MPVGLPCGKVNLMRSVTLYNGAKMPMIGYGTLQITDPAQCEQCVGDALACGYRLIDTAAVYGNERAVGAAVGQSGIARKELFITTKLWVQDAGYDSTLKAFDTSIKNLGLDYVDLYLIHQPFHDYYGAWRAMEELYKEGRIRAIGVSNFYPDRLVDLCVNAEIIPAVNQVECHPFFQQKDALKVMKEYGVQPEAWGPFAEGKNNFFQNPILAEIAAKYGKSVAQVALRWNVQRGVVVIPKSVHKERIQENFNIWDFELSDKDMETISDMDIGHSEIINHFTADTAKWLNELKIHP